MICKWSVDDLLMICSRYFTTRYEFYRDDFCSKNRESTTYTRLADRHVHYQYCRYKARPYVQVACRFVAPCRVRIAQMLTREVPCPGPRKIGCHNHKHELSMTIHTRDLFDQEGLGFVSWGGNRWPARCGNMAGDPSLALLYELPLWVPLWVPL